MNQKGRVSDSKVNVVTVVRAQEKRVVLLRQGGSERSSVQPGADDLFLSLLIWCVENY